MDKYRIIDEPITNVFGETVYQIEALRNFVCQGRLVQKGDLGGYVQKYENLSQEGDCWVFDNATATENAKVLGSACLSGECVVACNATISEYANIKDNAMIVGHSDIRGFVWIGGSAFVSYAKIDDSAVIRGHTKIDGLYDGGNDDCGVHISGDVIVSGHTKISKNAVLKSNSDLIYIHADPYGKEFYRTKSAYVDSKIGVRISYRNFTGSIKDFNNYIKIWCYDDVEKQECLSFISKAKKHFKNVK